LPTGVPVSTDAVFFDPGYSTANCTINANISVKGISINSGYTGTVTQSSGNTVTVGTSGYSQADGAFAGGGFGDSVCSFYAERRNF
jgi:hypothetical protein